MHYLRTVRSMEDGWCQLFSDDPVRPHIAIEQRIGPFAEAFFLVDEQDEPMAATCVRYCEEIPSSEDEMLSMQGADRVAIFYTIWSYRMGAGTKLLRTTVNHIVANRPLVSRFVTLSPKTSMARAFHTRNGAAIFRENDSTINYEYSLSSLAGRNLAC